MTTRAAIHALVDELDDTQLERARIALLQLRDDFELTDDDERELQDREAACDRGEKVDARGFLNGLRGKGSANRNG